MIKLFRNCQTHLFISEGRREERWRKGRQKMNCSVLYTTEKIELDKRVIKTYKINYVKNKINLFFRMVFLDDLAAKQRNRQLLADTAELGALLERIKKAYQEQSQAKLVTFSPSTISMSPKEMSQSIDNLNTPLPPEMSTVLQVRRFLDRSCYLKD